MVDSNQTHGTVVHEAAGRKVVWLGTDEQENQGVVQTNQYLIIDKDRGLLLDPGGVHLFARVVAAVSRFIELDRIETIVFTHQDPDVSSGIALWLGVTRAKVYISSLWVRFLPHFGIVDTSRIVAIEAASKSGPPNGIVFVPAHFLHSPGNWSVYDPSSRILFSSDIGAAVFPAGGQYVYVDDFAAHLPLIEGFHRRYMAGKKVLQAWVRAAGARPVSMIAPQHGAIYRGDSVGKLFAWLADLECGADRLDELYRNPS